MSKLGISGKSDSETRQEMDVVRLELDGVRLEVDDVRLKMDEVRMDEDDVRIKRDEVRMELDEVLIPLVRNLTLTSWLLSTTIMLIMIVDTVHDDDADNN